METAIEPKRVSIFTSEPAWSKHGVPLPHSTPSAAGVPAVDSGDRAE